MSFVRKFSGDRTKPIVAAYTCPEHGEFDAVVQRDENGEAPDVIACGGDVLDCTREHDHVITCSYACDLPATWTPSPVGCRVRRVEVTRGKWEKPERKTYLDTRNLGEGQDPDEWQAERRKMWAEKRRAEIKDALR